MIGQIQTENLIFVIKAQCEPYPDELASTLLSRIRTDIVAIELPDGYTLQWGWFYWSFITAITTGWLW